MNFILALGLTCLICIVAGCLAAMYQSPMKLSDKVIIPALVPTWFLVVTFSLLLIGGIFPAI